MKEILMNRITKLYDRFFPSFKVLPAGIYHFQSAEGPNGPYRLHLRLEANGEGILILNASTVLHLNKTAAEFAYYLVHSNSDDDVSKQLRKRYNVDPEVARKDYDQFKSQLDTLINTPDLDPVTFLNLDQKELYTAAISAPYRLDCALTYLLDEGSLGYAPVDRVKRELELDEWKKILDNAWKAGIPHVIFTGGEPTLRQDLPQIISYTEKIGMVCGLLTNGIRLADADYARTLLMNGLDHLMLVLDTENDEAWTALRNVIKEDISVTVHITLTEQVLPEVNSLLDYLGKLGVRQISLSISDLALKDALQKVSQTVAEKGLRLIWDLPVPYSQFHPVALELAEHNEVPQGAGRAWLYVEPDGDVLPAQGVNEVMGNLLNDPWEKIWVKP
jgi:organic radical activating enzyme